MNSKIDSYYGVCVKNMILLRNCFGYWFNSALHAMVYAQDRVYPIKPFTQAICALSLDSAYITYLMELSYLSCNNTLCYVILYEKKEWYLVHFCCVFTSLMRTDNWIKSSSRGSSLHWVMRRPLSLLNLSIIALKSTVEGSFQIN